MKVAAILSFLVALVEIAATEAFATPEGGWKTRPLIPELSTAPEAEAEAETGAGAKKIEAKETKKREKWDLGRFISQSSKFVSLPKPPLPGFNTPITVAPGDTLWSSATATASENKKQKQKQKPLFGFAPLDDVVMGGVSSSSFQNGIWSGTVSDSNSGGFIGIRSTPFSNSLNMQSCQGIELTVKGGEGKVFKAVVRDSTDFNGICWTAAFGGTKNKNKLKGIGGLQLGSIFGADVDVNTERTVRIPFEDLTPTIFARTVPNQSLNKRTIEGFQIAFSKFLFDGELNEAFELGDFELELVQVKAY